MYVPEFSLNVTELLENLTSQISALTIASFTDEGVVTTTTPLFPPVGLLMVTVTIKVGPQMLSNFGRIVPVLM